MIEQELAQLLDMLSERRGVPNGYGEYVIDENGCVITDEEACIDCKMHYDFFMVPDSVWKEAGYKKRDLACIFCFTKRLGRPLRIEDFGEPDGQNNTIFVAYLMGLRARK